MSKTGQASTPARRPLSVYVLPEARAQMLECLQPAESLSDFVEAAILAECSRRNAGADPLKKEVKRVPTGKRPQK